LSRLTTDRHKASCGLSATAELLVAITNKLLLLTNYVNTPSIWETPATVRIFNLNARITGQQARTVEQLHIVHLQHTNVTYFHSSRLTLTVNSV